MTVQRDVEDALAAFRITRMVLYDRVPFGALRTRLRVQALQLRARENQARGNEGLAPETDDPFTVELLECPWCMGVWVALFVLIVRRLPGWRLLARLLACSAITGLLNQAVREE